MLKQSISDSLIYTILGVLSRGIGLLLIPVYTRILTPAQYGLLDLIILISTLAFFILTLEIGQGCARFFPELKSEAEKKDFFSANFFFTFLIYSGAIGLLALLAPLIAPKIIPIKDGIPLYMMGLLFIWTNGISQQVHNHLRWEFLRLEFGIAALAIALISACLVLLFALAGMLNLTTILFSLTMGQFSALLYSLYKLRHRLQLRISRKALAVMLSFSSPLVISSAAVWVNNYIDRVALLQLMSLSDVGVYALAFRIAGIISITLIGLQQAISPLIYTHYKDPQTPEQIAQLFRYFVAVILLIFAIMALFSHEIILIVSGDAYREAAPIMPILVASIVISQSYVFMPGIFLAKKTLTASYINICGAVVNVLGNLALIPILGLAGAAISTLAGSLILFCLYLMIGHKYYPIPFEWRPIFKLTGFTLLLVVCAQILIGTGLLGWAIKTGFLITIFLSILFFRVLLLSEAKNAVKLVKVQASRILQ